MTIEPELRRADAEALIWKHEKALYEERRRREEAPEIEAYRRRLEELKPRIRELVPNWAPSEFEDAVSYMCYVTVVEHALEHATHYDLIALQSGPFYDGLHKDSDPITISSSREIRRRRTSSDFRRRYFVRTSMRSLRSSITLPSSAIHSQ